MGGTLLALMLASARADEAAPVMDALFLLPPPSTLARVPTHPLTTPGPVRADWALRLPAEVAAGVATGIVGGLVAGGLSLPLASGAQQDTDVPLGLFVVGAAGTLGVLGGVPLGVHWAGGRLGGRGRLSGALYGEVLLSVAVFSATAGMDLEGGIRPLAIGAAIPLGAALGYEYTSAWLPWSPPPPRSPIWTDPPVVAPAAAPPEVPVEPPVPREEDVEFHHTWPADDDRVEWQASLGPDSLVGPRDAALGDERIYVAQRRGVLVLESSSGAVGRLKLAGRRTVALAASGDGTLFVADRGRGEIIVLDPDLGELGGIGLPWLTRPDDLAVSPTSGQIWVAEAATGRLLVFGRDGALVRTVASVGGRTLEAPTSVAFGPDGRLFVLDAGQRVIVCDEGGAPLATWALDPGDAWRTTVGGLAVDAESRVYLARPSARRVEVYTLQGEPIVRLGATGGDPGRLVRPAAVAIGPDGLVYVADSGQRRVVVYRWAH